MIFSSLLTLCKIVGNVVKAKGLVISKHWKLVVAPRCRVHGKSWPNFMESYKKICIIFLCLLCASISAPTTIVINTHKLNNIKSYKFNAYYPNSIHLHKKLPPNIVTRIQIPYILQNKNKTKHKYSCKANTTHNTLVSKSK